MIPNMVANFRLHHVTEEGSCERRGPYVALFYPILSYCVSTVPISILGGGGLILDFLKNFQPSKGDWGDLRFEYILEFEQN